MQYVEQMIIVDTLEILKLRSLLLMPLSMQSLRNESEQFPNMPREIMEFLTSSIIIEVCIKALS